MIVKWIKASDIPKSWEGKEAWQWNSDNDNPPFITEIPKEFSRLPEHCGGIYFSLLIKPLPGCLK